MMVAARSTAILLFVALSQSLTGCSTTTPEAPVEGGDGGAEDGGSATTSDGSLEATGDGRPDDAGNDATTTDGSLEATGDGRADDAGNDATTTDGSLEATVDAGADATLADASDGSTADVARALDLLAGGQGGPGNVDGVGSVARFGAPRGLASDGSGNLYVTDYANDAIRKVAIATGAVTTLAGSSGNSGSADGTGSAARFNSPIGAAADGSGNLYVTDSANNTIRKIVIATGAVTTLAGSQGMVGGADGTGPAALFNAPEGIASDGVNLYVSSAQTIRQVVIATGAVTTIAGSYLTSGNADLTGPAARFNGPSGIAIGGAGNLFVADSFNGSIRQVIIATGAVSTVATLGTSDAGVTVSPGGLATDGAGTLYATASDETIKQIVVATGAVTTIAGTPGHAGSTDGTAAGASFSGLSGLLMGPSGHLYIADSNNSSIRDLVVATGAASTLAGSGHDPSGSFSTDGTGSAASFRGPLAVDADDAGTVYFADMDNDTVGKLVLATGTATTLAGLPGTQVSADGAVTFSLPTGVAWDGSGNLYISELVGAPIRRLVLASGAVTPFATSDAGVVYATAVACDRAGHLFVVSLSAILQVDLASGNVSTLAGSATSGSADGVGPAASFGLHPGGIAPDGANLYVADTGNDTIRQIVVATGAVTTIAGSPGVPGSADGVGAAALFRSPGGIASDGAGHLYVADTGNSTVRMIDLTSGAVTTPVGVVGQAGIRLGPLPAELDSPRSLVVPSPGSIVIADEGALLLAH